MKRETMQAALLGLAATLSVVVSGWLLRNPDLNGVMRIAAALLPVVLMGAFVVAEFRVIRRADEFHRRMVVESLAFAFPGGILLAMGLDQLQKAGYLVGADAGDVWPFMGLVWAGALWAVYSRRGASPACE